MASIVKGLIEERNQLPEHRQYRRVAGALGLLIEVAGLVRHLSLGTRCDVATRDGRSVASEVIGFREGRPLLLPFGSVGRAALGCRAAEDETTGVMARQGEVHAA